MALNTLIKLADKLDRDGNFKYAENIEKVIDAICEKRVKQASNYLIKVADFFDSKNLSDYAEMTDYALTKMAEGVLGLPEEEKQRRQQDLANKKRNFEIKLVSKRNQVSGMPEGPEKERAKRELRQMESGLQKMRNILEPVKTVTRPPQERVREFVQKTFKPEKSHGQERPSANYLVSKENFVRPSADGSKIRSLIHSLSRLGILPAKYSKTIKSYGGFTWPVYWIVNSLADKLNLPNYWQTAFDRSAKNLSDAERAKMVGAIEDALQQAVSRFGGGGRAMPEYVEKAINERMGVGEKAERDRARMFREFG